MIERESQPESLPPAEFIRIQLVRGKYVRKDDPTAKPFINPLPPCLQERCIATPGLIAEVVDMNTEVFDHTATA